MVLRFSFDIISGISQVVYWIVMALVQCMTLVFPLMLSCLLSLRVGIGSGPLLSPIQLWRFNVGYLRFLLEVLICLFGNLSIVFILVQQPGIS
jgi:hypothetical protein